MDPTWFEEVVNDGASQMMTVPMIDFNNDATSHNNHACCSWMHTDADAICGSTNLSNAGMDDIGTPV